LQQHKPKTIDEAQFAWKLKKKEKAFACERHEIATKVLEHGVESGQHLELLGAVC